jgi:hypothetical protein
MALEASVGAAEFVGIDGLTISVNSWSFPSTRAAAPLGNGTTAVENTTFVDFSADTSKDGTVGTPLLVETGPSSTYAITMDGREVLKAEGAVELDVFGFFYASGTFAFEKASDTVTLSDGSADVPVETLQIGATVSNAFVGVNGPYLVDSNGNGVIEVNDTPNEDALGLSLSNVEFALALLKKKPTGPTDTDQRSWMALNASVGSAAFVGVDGLTIEVFDLAVSINQGSGTNNGVDNTTVVDFSGPDGGMPINTGDGTPVVLDFAEETLKAQGGVEIGVFGFFYARGTFAFEKSSETVILSDGTTGVQVEALQIGATVSNAFVGVNGPYLQDSNNDGVIDDSDTPNDDALGLSLSNVEFALSLMKKKPTSPTDVDKRSWTALKASVGSAAFVGVDGLTIEVFDLFVAINQGGGTNAGVANSTVVNFSGMPGGGMAINTGDGTPVILDFATETLKAQGGVELGVFGFFYARGTFAFEKTSQTVRLSDGTTNVQVESLQIGATVSNAFVGVNGPYLVDSNNDGIIDANDTPSEDALGLSLSNVEFALAVMKKKPTGPTDTDKRSWTALKASVGTAEFVGVDGITVKVFDLGVAINQGGGTNAGVANTTVVNFSGMPGGGMAINTGDGTPVLMDFAAKTLKAQGGVELDVFGFFYARGTLAFEKTTQTVTLSDGTTNVQVESLQIGATVQNAFVGVNGPYLQDSNNDGIIDANDTPNDDALGLSLGNVEFALALLKKKPTGPTDTDKRSWTSLKASIGSAEFVGVDNLTIAVNNLNVIINQGGGTNAGAANTTVVNYKGMPGGGIEINTGDGTPVLFDMDGSRGQLLEASGVVTLGINKDNGEELISISSGFLFTREVVVNGTVTTSKIKIGAAGIEIFIGDGTARLPDNDPVNPGGINPDATGVLITDVKFGLVLFSTKDSANPANDSSSFALNASGGAQLIGVDGLTLGGTLGVKFNKTGKQVNEQLSVPVPGGGTETIDLVFTSTSAAAVISGSVNLEIDGLVALSGAFAVSREVEVNGTVRTTKILIAAADIDAFLGVNEGTEDEIGIRVTDAQFGLVLYSTKNTASTGSGTTSYAITAAGSAGFVGLDGLVLYGSVGIQVNNTGKVVNESILVPGDDGDIAVNIVFPTAAKTLAFQGDVVLKIGQTDSNGNGVLEESDQAVFELAGTISFRKGPGGVRVDIPNAELRIHIGGEEVFGISGAAKFSISDTEGFKLENIRMNGFSIFGFAPTDFLPLGADEPEAGGRTVRPDQGRRHRGRRVPQPQDHRHHLLRS